MVTWIQFYENNKNNFNENYQSLWMKYNEMVYVHSLYSGNSGGRQKIQNNNDTINNYVVDDYVIDYLE